MGVDIIDGNNRYLYIYIIRNIYTKLVLYPKK